MLKVSTRLKVFCDNEYMLTNIDRFFRVFKLSISKKNMNTRCQSFGINESKIQDQVIEIGSWLSTQELAAIFHINAIDLSMLLKKWKSERKILAVVYRDRELFPRWAFDDIHGRHPIKGLKPTLQLCGDSRSNWGLAYWYVGVNGYFGGTGPMDLLKSNSPMVLGAAKNELAGIQHG